jgi:hypothetical protein
MLRVFRGRGNSDTLLGFLARNAQCAFQAWLNGTLEHTAKPALRWVLAMEISYLIAAGLAITAAVFILSAISSGLVELGLPHWAAQLILGVVAAGIGFLLYKRGANKRLQEELEDVEEEPRGLRLRIVKGGPVPEPRSRPRRVAGVFDVHPRHGAKGWEVTSRSPRMRESYETKEKALSAARRRASEAERARVVVHRSSGDIQDVLRYGDGSSKA